MSGKTIYFPGFNGIRAIAALIVLIWHVDLYMPMFGYPENGFHHNGMAGQAVNLFFVLSGFLITYLLLTEKQVSGTVSIRSFYVRRILRIWPIYYLALVISLVLVWLNATAQPAHFGQSILLYSFLLANVAYILDIGIAPVIPLWSVGVEEQFYAFWPALVKKTKHILTGLLAVITIYLLLKLGCWFIKSDSIAYKFLDATRIDLMALGGIGAYMIYHDRQVFKKIIYSPVLQIMAWGVLVYGCVFKPLHLFSFIDNELNSLFYFILIVNVGTNPKNLVNLENAVLNYLGKISYGLYVYHVVVMFILAFLFGKAGWMAQIRQPGVYVLVIGSTILLAALSFKYFETPMLRLKKKFTLVQSTGELEKTEQATLAVPELMTIHKEVVTK